MDSYDKYIRDFLNIYCCEHLFDCVHKEDKDEVMQAFVVEITHRPCANNFRVYPLSRAVEYYRHANRGCCGSFNSQVKCKSGRIYWIGCNYGH